MLVSLYLPKIGSLTFFHFSCSFFQISNLLWMRYFNIGSPWFFRKVFFHTSSNTDFFLYWMCFSWRIFFLWFISNSCFWTWNVGWLALRTVGSWDWFMKKFSDLISRFRRIWATDSFINFFFFFLFAIASFDNGDLSIYFFQVDVRVHFNDFVKSLLEVEV